MHQDMESSQVIYGAHSAARTEGAQEREGTQESERALLGAFSDLRVQTEEATRRALTAERAHRLCEESEGALAAQLVQLRGEVDDARMQAARAEHAQDLSSGCPSPNLASPRSQTSIASRTSCHTARGRVVNGDRKPTPNRAPRGLAPRTGPAMNGDCRPTPSRTRGAAAAQQPVSERGRPTTPSRSARGSPAIPVQSAGSPVRAGGGSSLDPPPAVRVDPLFRDLVKEHTAAPFAVPRRAAGGAERPATPNRGRGGAQFETSRPFSPLARR